MKRSFLLIAATALLFVMGGSGQNTPKKSALDKPTLEAYLRHLWVLDPQMSMTIADPQPSELPGFQDVKVKIAMGPQSQEVALMVSKDGAKVLQASVWDINSNPFKKDIDKLKTQFEPSIGTPGATVVIVAFSDFQCPYCKEEAQMLRKNLLAAFPTQVRLYFKTFPLERPAPLGQACRHCVALRISTGRRCLLGVSRLDLREPSQHHTGESEGQSARVGQGPERCRLAAPRTVH
jgi:hypothetical protein